MPKQYELKKEYLSKSTVNRVIKTIIANAKEDRRESKDLLDQVKARLSAASADSDNDTYSKLATASAQMLRQLQDSSTNLIKAMDAIIKYLSLTDKKGTADGTQLDNLFDQLNSINS